MPDLGISLGLDQRPGGSPAFSLDQLGTVHFWARANDLALVDGDPVSSFTDRSGNGRHATQATAAKKPTFKTGIAGFNGNPCLQFDGVDDVLATPAFGLGVFTIIAVWKASANGVVYFLKNSGGAGAPYLYTSTGMTSELYRGVTNHSDRQHALNWGIGSVMRISTHRFNGTHASHTLRLQGTNIAWTNGAGTANPGTGLETNPLGIGSRDDGALNINGYLAEIIVYAASLSDAACLQAEQNLGAKYAIAVP